MGNLTEQEARRILTPVHYDQWLAVGRMHMPSGIHRETLSSLKEIYWFLAPNSKTLPAVDFNRLADWIEMVLKDRQTAGQVRKIAADSPCYVDTCKATYDLIGSRVEEAEEILNNTTSV